MPKAKQTSKRGKRRGPSSLTVAQRMQLAQDLWDSVVAEQDALDLTDEERRLLDDRLKAHEKDPGAAIPWERVRAESLQTPRPTPRR